MTPMKNFIFARLAPIVRRNYRRFFFPDLILCRYCEDPDKVVDLNYLYPFLVWGLFISGRSRRVFDSVAERKFMTASSMSEKSGRSGTFPVGDIESINFPGVTPSDLTDKHISIIR